MDLVVNNEVTRRVERTSPRVKSILVGAASGAIATVVMSAWMLGLQRSGLLGRMPPRLITDRMLSAVGVKRKLSRGERSVAAVAAHFAFGATQGALYTVLLVLARRGHSEALSKASATHAVPFALLVWAISYAGWVPAFGIMRPPKRDRPGRPTSMLLSHVVFGLALAAAVRSASRLNAVRKQVSDGS